MKKELFLFLALFCFVSLFATERKSTIPFTPVVSEDFSLWSKGSESIPYGEMEGGKDRKYKIDASLTHQAGWMGNYIYQAGGCAYLKLNNEGRAGHIHTPEMALYGEVKITFRAKILAGKQKKGQLWIALCDNTTGPIDNKDVDLTTEWKTFEMLSSKGTFNDKNIFQLQPLDCDVLIDDIVVQRRKTMLMPPQVLAPINTSATSFQALWTSSPDASSYLCSVYYLDMPKKAIPKQTIVEGFDKINIGKKGKIEVDNPNYPAGWKMDLSTNGSVDISQKEGYYHSAPLSLVLDAKGDYILTPPVDAPITGLSFWIRPSTIEPEKNFNYTLLEVAVLSDGKWQAIANLPNTWMNAEGGFYSFDPEMLKTYNIKQVRLEVIQKNNVTFYIDDITYTYGSKPIPYYLVKDKEVRDTLYNVASYDPSKEHFYYVQAKNGEVLSDATYPIWVDGLIGVTPQVKQPTEITEKGYTAHWEKLHNAGYYQVNNYKILNYKKEEKPQIILYETFDKINIGSVQKPITPNETVVQLAKEELTPTDWMVQLPAYAKGMIGVKETTPYSSTAGLVLSPTLYLKSDGGAFEVSLKAQSTVARDTLFVMIMKDYTDRQVEEYMRIPFPIEGGSVNTAVKFLATNRVELRENIRIGFMSARGKPFYIDEVSIKQNIREGESSYAPYWTTYPTDGQLTVQHDMKGQDFVYNVQAFRSRFYKNYISEISDFMRVKNPFDKTYLVPLKRSINPLIIAHTLEGVRVCSSSDDILLLYDSTGRLLRQLNLSKGLSISIPLSAGYYIFKTLQQSYKILVR